MQASLDRRIFPISFQSYDYHVIFLFSACVIYGLFGSPTPDSFGFVELFLGVLLALSIGFGRFSNIVLGRGIQRFWKSAGRVFLLYGLGAPMVVATLGGHSFQAILRDLVPFLFLFLPLFALPVIRARPHYFRSLLVAVVLIGLLFSLRSLLMRFDFYCSFWCGDELLYLENMPTVLFAALFLIGSSLNVVAGGLTLRRLVLFASFMTLALLPVAAMAVTAQRASLGAVFLYGLIIQGLILYRSPVRGMNAMILGLFGLAVINISFLHVFQVLLQKTADVGLNMRPQEMVAVWEIVTLDPLSFVFGTGWGGAFNNPAVGGLSVNFTHNFFSSIFLKTGLIGFLLAFAYMLGLLERLGRVILKNAVLGFALLAPILIDLTLYASFKSLDFGLMLLMISGSLVYMRTCADRQS